MDRSDFIRRLVLTESSDDYENVDQIILPNVGRTAAKCGLTVERSDIISALAVLTCTLRSAGCVATTSSRNATNSWLVWRWLVCPRTSPVCGFSAAYNDSVPWR